MTDAALSPTWRPPKAPLSPHRLAKLANALGVATPIPATSRFHASLSRSFSESASPIDHFRRSPTPSSGFPSTSKYLLHVIPPNHLPHDSDDQSALPTPNAPGYHTQFRRGTLVPVHPTLQAQLGAIAKEYALPSTVGLILYLVSASAQSPSPVHEPGPRLSEDIWKHLWTRVLRAEQPDDGLLPTPSQSNSSLFLLGSTAARSSPSLPTPSPVLRPFLASPSPSPISFDPHHPPNHPSPPPSPSSLSISISDHPSVNNKSAAPSSASASVSVFEPDPPDTPDTSVASSVLDLPGLRSPSLIPILAKVEFDIDKRKAAWYLPWVRSRKANHAKRATSRKNSHHDAEEPHHETGEHLPIELLTGTKKPLQFFKSDDLVAENGYAPLSASPDVEDDNSDSHSEQFSEDATARVSSTTMTMATARNKNRDPLGDVFGTDAETWADIHSANRKPRSSKSSNPNIVNLALSANEIAELDEDDAKSSKEEDDVIEMLDMMSKPELAIFIPSPPKNASLYNGKRSSSPSAARKIPPPLALKHKDKSRTVVPSQLTPLPLSADPSGLAYLGDTKGHANENNDDDDDYEGYERMRSPAESEKRGGAVFDDLDLGLDPTEEFDQDDPNDRRKSQYIMRAQLDEIERTLAQLSPRILNADIKEEQNRSFAPSLSPGSPSLLALPPLNRNFFPLSPPPTASDQTYLNGGTWPAAPLSSSIRDKEGLISATNTSTAAPNQLPPASAPRLTVNGVSASSTHSHRPQRGFPPGTSRSPVDGASDRWKRRDDDDGVLLPPAKITGLSLDPPGTPTSPVIPLSPDPFGRHPSAETQSLRLTSTEWEQRNGDSPEHTAQSRSTTTSRFSADSIYVDDAGAGSSSSSSVGGKLANKPTLISVKNIKNLWRKSNKSSAASSSTSNLPPPTPTVGSFALLSPSSSTGRTSPNVNSIPPSPAVGPSPPLRPRRPSEGNLFDDAEAHVDHAMRSSSSGRLQQQQTFGRLSLHQQQGVGGGPLPPPLPPMSRESLNPTTTRRPSPAQDVMPVQTRFPPQQMQGVGLGVSVGGPGQQQQQPPAQQFVLSPPRKDSMNVGHMLRMSVDQQNTGNGVPLPMHSQGQASVAQLGVGHRPTPSHPHPQHLSRPPRPQQQHLQRMSVDQQNAVQHLQQRPSLERQQIVSHHPHQSLQQQQQNRQQQQNFQQPTFPGPNLNPSPAPIITPRIKASKVTTNLDRLHFDQESPYPVRLIPQVRQSPRPPSPPPLPAIPEQDKHRPLMKWSSKSSGSSVNNVNKDHSGNGGGGNGVGVPPNPNNPSSNKTSEAQPRSSFERPGSVHSRAGARRPSVINNFESSSSRISVTTPGDIPQNPHIRHQYMNNRGTVVPMDRDHHHHQRPSQSQSAPHQGRSQSQRSRTTTASSSDSSSGVSASAGGVGYPSRQERKSSLHSQSSSLSGGARSTSPPPPLPLSRSMGSLSLESSQEHANIDASQFEFVSLKAKTLSYPHHDLDSE